LLKYILHDWDDAACRRILACCRKAIAPGGKLLAIESVVPPPGVVGHSKLDDVEMLVLFGSQERTEEEFRELLLGSGFRLVRVIPTMDAVGTTTDVVSIVEAEPV
jgi:hypothetical protein